MNPTVFILSVGYILGLLIVLISAGIFSAPSRCILKILFNGALGATILCAFNIITKPYGLYIDLNPITSVFIGILGTPGVLALIILSLIL